MPKIVKAHTAQSVFLQKFWKRTGKILRSHTLAHFVHEHKAVVYNSAKYDDANARKAAFCISLMSDIFRYEVSANARAYSLIIAPHALRRPRLKIRFGLLAAVPKKASSRQNEAGGTMLLTT